jgi:predicted NBD/HSP70 family sugar kinase
MKAPKELRAANVAVVLDALRRHGSMSRTELARVTGLSRTTVISIVDELAERQHIAISDRPAQHAMGRPAAEISLHAGAGVVVGISAAGEDLELVLTDLAGALLTRRGARIDGAQPLDELADLVVRRVDDALADAGVSRPRLVGVGLAAAPSPSGSVPRALSGPLAQRLGAPVTVQDDGRLEALAECTLGAGRGMRHIVYVHVAASIRGAVMLDGLLRIGPTGTAGGLGHVPVRADGPECACGRRGCLSSIASGEALLHAVAQVHGTDLDLDGLVALARDGDPAARRAMADAGEEIGAVVAALCTALDPEAVIVGGLLAAADLPLLDAVRDHVATGKLLATGPVVVLPATLGRVAAALGAASVVARSPRA